MQQQVELAGGQCASVALLPVQHQVAPVAPLLLYELRGVDEHAAGARRGIADAHPLARLQQLDDQPHHRSRRVELAALPAGVVRELMDQVLVGVTQHVADATVGCCKVGVLQIQLAEMIQQPPDNPLSVGRATQPRLVVPVHARQHAVQPWRVLEFDLLARHVQRLAQVHRSPNQRRPPRRLRHKELVLVRVRQRHVPRNPQRHRRLHLFVEPVRQPLQEQRRKNEILIVRRVDLPPQNIRGPPQLRFQLLLTKRHVVSLFRPVQLTGDVLNQRIPQLQVAQLRCFDS